MKTIFLLSCLTLFSLSAFANNEATGCYEIGLNIPEQTHEGDDSSKDAKTGIEICTTEKNVQLGADQKSGTAEIAVEIKDKSGTVLRSYQLGAFDKYTFADESDTDYAENADALDTTKPVYKTAFHIDFTMDGDAQKSGDYAGRVEIDDNGISSGPLNLILYKE